MIILGEERIEMDGIYMRNQSLFIPRENSIISREY
jgi:hypothetical protein